MPITSVDSNQPKFYLFPVNNNRTAWRPFGLPMIMIVPKKRDSVGFPLENSMVFNVKIYIEDVPDFAYVAGHQNIGRKYPDRELYAKTLDSLTLADCYIDLNTVTIQRNGEPIELADALNGDIITYRTLSGVQDTIQYIQGADYYDLSNILLDIELLAPDTYNIVYQAYYYTRLVSTDGKFQFLCIDVNNTSLALYRFKIQHPGKVLEEFYRHTPPPYLSNSSKALDTTVGFYRPFTDILQDIMDEQDLLERVNWVYDTPAEIIPYMSSLLGWDLPYFPNSLDNLRKAVLRRTVEFQNLKGSRRAIINIFRLFGFEILISNLWWSSDGKRLIRPDINLPVPYQNEKITVNAVYQIDLALSDLTPNNFQLYNIPLLFKPQSKVGKDQFVAIEDSGIITIDAYAVKSGSAAYVALSAIAQSIKDNIDYGKTADCYLDSNGFIIPRSIHEAMAGLEIIGYSQLTLKKNDITVSDSVLVGVHPPFINANVRMDRELNTINCSLNGSFDVKDNVKVFAFITYEKLDLIVPDAIATLQSNRFDLQILRTNTTEFADPATLDFAIEFVYRLKAFHSILNVVRTRLELSETYEVTDLSIGGDFDQRYDTDIGRLQVPPAIIPNIPGIISDCTALDPISLGYKQSDLELRLRKLDDLVYEYNAWRALDGRNTVSTEDLLLSIPQNAPNRNESLFTYRGQDRLKSKLRTELRVTEFTPSPNANKIAAGSYLHQDLSPNDNVNQGNYETYGKDTSVNGDAKSYGAFSREYTAIREPLITIDGAADIIYKGRVDDELLHRTAVVASESYKSIACSLHLGIGTYWAYPTISVVASTGVANPCYRSHTQKMTFSGGAPTASIPYYSQGIQATYLNANYNSKLSTTNDSFMGRLYRAYNHPSHETIHFSNRPSITDMNQPRKLALLRPSIEIQKPTLHLPGCRFARLNALLNDFEHLMWRARPWDDEYSESCGPSYICGVNLPSYLNVTKTIDESGDEHLVFDDLPFTVRGNGLSPDINSLGDHSVINLFAESDVIHAIYMNNATGNPAVILDQVQDYDTNVDINGVIDIETPLFNSHGNCGTFQRDYADGYPSSSGFLPYSDADLGRSGLFSSLLEGLGLTSGTESITSYLFTCNSGIRITTDHRLDCGSLTLDCGGTSNTQGLAYESIDHAAIFLDENGDYDWDTDHLRYDYRQLNVEEYNCETRNLDGSIPTLLELV